MTAVKNELERVLSGLPEEQAAGIFRTLEAREVREFSIEQQQLDGTVVLTVVSTDTYGRLERIAIEIQLSPDYPLTPPAVRTRPFVDRSENDTESQELLAVDDPKSESGRGVTAMRWPALGPGTLGTAVLLGWVTGVVGGPLVAIVGAVVGMFIGDALDRGGERDRTAA